MGTPEDPRKHYHPFDAPDDRSDPWRGRSLPILLVAFGLLALLILYVIFS